MHKTADQLVREASAEIETVSIETAKGLLDDSNVAFLDIRDIRELWREGKIPGAIHTPRGMLEFWADPTSEYHREVFASGKKLILYCAAAARSALATKALQDMGQENIAHLEGGFGGWREAGGNIADVPKKD